MDDSALEKKKGRERRTVDVDEPKGGDITKDWNQLMIHLGKRDDGEPVTIFTAAAFPPRSHFDCNFTRWPLWEQSVTKGVLDQMSKPGIEEKTTKKIENETAKNSINSSPTPQPSSQTLCETR